MVVRGLVMAYSFGLKRFSLAYNVHGARQNNFSCFSLDQTHSSSSHVLFHPQRKVMTGPQEQR